MLWILLSSDALAFYPCRMGEDGTHGSQHDKANLMTPNNIQMPLQESMDGGCVCKVGDDGERLVIHSFFYL